MSSNNLNTLQHWIPQGDLKPHCNFGMNCWCNPVKMDVGIIHIAADAREMFDENRPALIIWPTPMFVFWLTSRSQ